MASDAVVIQPIMPRSNQVVMLTGVWFIANGDSRCYARIDRLTIFKTACWNEARFYLWISIGCEVVWWRNNAGWR